jgi:hypothetical protein
VDRDAVRRGGWRALAVWFLCWVADERKRMEEIAWARGLSGGTHGSWAEAPTNRGESGKM